MKFLSNFDTNLEHEVVSKYVALYWKENVYCIHRAKIFWVFHCLVPSLWLMVLVSILLVLLSWDSWDSSLNSIKGIIFYVMMVAVIFIIWWKILKRYFDYKMDFCVVTTQEIAAYNQTWFLTRSSRTIDADKIKTVSVNTSWIWKSIFNFWDLTFLSEGDQSWWWDIGLSYVHDVNNTKNKVRELIEPHLQKHLQNHIKQHEERSKEVWSSTHKKTV